MHWNIHREYIESTFRYIYHNKCIEIIFIEKTLSEHLDTLTIKMHWNIHREYIVEHLDIFNIINKSKYS